MMTTMKTLQGTAAFALAFSLAGAPVDAQMRPQASQRQDRWSRAADVKQAKEFHGSLTALRAVDFGGQAGRHLLAKLRVNDRTVVADLGPVDELRAQKDRLRRGAQMQLNAVPGRVNDRPVLIVHDFTVDGRRTTARPPQAARMQPPARMKSSARMPHGMRAEQGRMQYGERAPSGGRTMAGKAALPTRIGPIMGEVVSLRTVPLRGEADDHRLAKIRTARGNTIVADLGSSRIPELNLSQGDRVVVQGDAARIGGQPVLYARSVAEIVDVRQPSSRPQRGSQQQRSRPSPGMGQNR